VSVCVHNGRSNTSAAAELAELRKIATFQGNTIFNEHPVSHLASFSAPLTLRLLFPIPSFHGRTRDRIGGESAVSENCQMRERKIKVLVKSQNIKKAQQLTLQPYHDRYRVFIEYCVFSVDFKIFRTLVFLCFPSVPVCYKNHEEHQRRSRTGRVQKNHQIFRKKHTIQ